MKNLYESIKQIISEKTLTPFQQEFAKQMKEKGPGKTFTWQDPKTGKSTEILLKYKEEPKPQAAVKPEVKKEPPKVEPPKPEVKKDPEPGFDKKKSDELFADIRKDAQGKSPEEIRAAAKKALSDTEADLAKKEAPKPAEPIKAEPQSAEMEIKTVDMIKDKEKNSKKTNEEIKMSINKKFNVSDALYSSVMEVMAKSSGGTVPKNEKQKQLAAHHGDPNLITHGDVLKARGVKMKEEAELDEASTIRFTTNASSWTDNQKKVTAIHKSLRQAHPDKIAKAFGGGPNNSGYVTVKNKEHLDAVKKHIIKAGGTIKEEAEQVDELSRGKLVGYIEKASKTKGAEAISRISGIKKAAQKLKDIKKQSMSEQSIDEAKKKVGEYSEGEHTVKVYHHSGNDNEGDPYVVKLFKGGKHYEPADYFTDDKEDAHSTAKNMVKRAANVKEESELDEMSYSAKAARAGKDIGKPGKNFEKIAKAAAERYGSEKAGKNVAGYILKMARKRAAGEHAMEEKIIEGTMRGGKYVDDAPRPGTNEVPVPDEGYRPPKSQPKKTVKSPDTTKLSDVEEAKNMDTPGNSYEHQCAIHVRSESFGEGRTITTQHADPDENGNIAWYDVMFEHGIEKGVPTNSLEILVSESHMHSKRKKKGM